MPSITWTSNRFSKNLNYSELGGSLSCLTFFCVLGDGKIFHDGKFCRKEIVRNEKKLFEQYGWNQLV